MNRRCLLQGTWTLLLFFACLAGIALALPKQKQISHLCTKVNCKELSQQQLQQISQAITVKVLAKDFLGSGSLLKNEGLVYTVITNAHVLRTAEPPYQIQTPDGRIYQATIVKNVSWDGNDLGLLQFRSTGAVYQVGNLADSSSLAIGDKVFVGGFTSRIDESQTNRFVFTSGQVSLVLDKALEAGYQIGYTNDIRKGMSGAPLLNYRGEIVGINGRHKYPLWDAPELYKDGSQVCKPLKELITSSSLAVPIKTVVQLAPKFATKPKIITQQNSELMPIESDLEPEKDKYIPYSILQMQAAADAAKNCI
ncbi:MAG: serine protease [Gloeotrichia echinulata IR180]